MPPKRANPKSYERARELRKELTPAEKKLWACLRGDQLNGVNFRRQHAIGDFIVDFVCIKKKLVIELDGGHHREPQEREYDAERTQNLESVGYKVIRFWNGQVENEIESVLRTIEMALKQL